MLKHLLRGVPKVKSYDELYDLPWKYIESKYYHTKRIVFEILQ